MHSVGLEPTKWILIGTRTTYQATEDAGLTPSKHTKNVVDWGRVHTIAVDPCYGDGLQYSRHTALASGVAQLRRPPASWVFSLSYG